MAEIDVNLYKQDEKMRTYCEKKEKRIEKLRRKPITCASIML